MTYENGHAQNGNGNAATNGLESQLGKSRKKAESEVSQVAKELQQR